MTGPSLSLMMWFLAYLLIGAAIGLVVLWSAPDGWRARAVAVFTGALLGVPVLLVLLCVWLWEYASTADAAAAQRANDLGDRPAPMPVMDLSDRLADATEAV